MIRHLFKLRFIRVLLRPSILFSSKEKMDERPECTQTYMRTFQPFLTPLENKRCRFRKNSIRSQKGGILLYILGMIALLSIVVTEFLMETASAIRYRSQVTHRSDLESLAYSALETTLAVLGEIKLADDGLYAPSQGWNNPLQYAKFPIPKGYEITVTIIDETGKLSIYEQDQAALGELLQEMEFSYENIVNLQSELKKWLSKPKELSVQVKLNSKKTLKENATPAPTSRPNATSDTASNQNPSPQPQDKDKKKDQRIVYNLLQLKEIPAFERMFFDAKGYPNEKFKSLNEVVSILHKGVFNINTAPELLKKMALGYVPYSPVTRSVPYNRSMADLGIEGDTTNLAKIFGFKANILNISIQVNRGSVKYYLNAIVDVGGESGNSQNKKGFTFLALTEDGNFDK